MRKPKFYAAAYAIIENEKWEILFMRRQNTWFRDWYFQVPAGHLEGEESIKFWLIREMEEELWINILESDCEIKHISHRVSKDNRVYFDVYIEVKKYSWEKKKINLNLDTKDKDIEIEANKNYFYILLNNIISNAIKYNKKSGTLWISIWENFITISDSWIWIPKDETKKVFERFYRTKNHKWVEWHWLWLSMVEKIAKIYNWKIEIESIEGVWTKVKIRF